MAVINTIEPIVITGSQELIFINQVELNLHFLQKADSVLRVFIYNIHPHDDNVPAPTFQTSILCEQQDANCTTEIYSLAYLHQASQSTFNATVRHQVSGGTSRQVSRFVLNDQSRGSYAGEVILAPNAQKVDAQQNNRNLLLSDECEMHIKPCLEIYADDVKASHGTSTGQLDEQAIFYMQQRGISFSTAQKILTQAFMAECITPLNDEKKREEILQMLL